MVLILGLSSLCASSKLIDLKPCFMIPERTLRVLWCPNNPVVKHLFCQYCRCYNFTSSSGWWWMEAVEAPVNGKADGTT